MLHTYGVDILTGENASVYVNTAILQGLDWKETHRLGEPELFAINNECASALMRIAAGRDFEKATERIWEKNNHGKDLNSPMTKEERMALYRDLLGMLEMKAKPEHRDKVLDKLKETIDRLGGVDHED